MQRLPVQINDAAIFKVFTTCGFTVEAISRFFKIGVRLLELQWIPFSRYLLTHNSVTMTWPFSGFFPTCGFRVYSSGYLQVFLIVCGFRVYFSYVYRFFKLSVGLFDIFLTVDHASITFLKVPNRFFLIEDHWNVFDSTLSFVLLYFYSYNIDYINGWYITEIDG